MDPLERVVCQLTEARRATRGDTIQSLWGGYGSLLRMELEGVEASRVVVKHVQPPVQHLNKNSESARSHERKLRSYSIEANWYDRYAGRCDAHCRVPRCLGRRAELGNWLFVLEDLDAAGFSRRTTAPNSEEVHAVLRWLAAFHATFVGTKPVGLWAVGTYWHLATRPEELRHMKDRVLREAASSLDARLSSGKFRTLVHGDAKVDNFCFSPRSSNPVAAAVDYQYVGGGCGMKDVAYFFSSIWNSAECEANASSAIDYYFGQLSAELAVRHPQIEVPALIDEWRALYPVAWADFQRFLSGWAPGQYDDERYAQRMVHLALSAR